ncbi:MAG TPA: methyl-accepting chemotaxis protein [Limnochordia bacterium]|nr:methyl-accepting chemotaxis protein [Limnochordia bacterium]
MVKLTIGKKLGLGFLILIFVVALVNVVSVLGLEAIKVKWEQSEGWETLQGSLQQREIEHLHWVNQLQDHLVRESAEGFSLELDPTRCNLGQWLASAEFQHLLQQYPAMVEHFQLLISSHTQLHASAQSIKSFLERGDARAAEQVYQEVTAPSLAQIRGVLAQVRGELGQDVTRVGAEVRRLMASIIQQVMILASAGIAVSLVSATVVTRSITKPLAVLKQAALQVGEGDLGTTWTIQSRDEIGDLSESLAQMAANLRKLVKGIQENSERVLALSQDLSSMAVETGSAVSQVASTANEFSGTSVTMAENTGQMRTSAEHAMAELERGLDLLKTAVGGVASAREDVQQLTAAVNSLAERSRQISAIVELITDISDQTNLLALNAAIEAARAGENGRGFAVVADEVRKLAEESRTASGRIADLIQEILRGTAETMERMGKADHSVEEVAEQIGRTGDTFAGITRTFQDVAAQVGSIAQAAAAVGTGSEEIAAATQEQSAVVNAIAENSEKLAHLAEQLQEQIARFKGF